VARRCEAVQVLLLLLALLAVFFGKAIFTGRKLLPADIAYLDPVFRSQAPPGFTEPHNVLLYDQAYQSYPWRVQIAEALSQGSLPFWNPHIYCGSPLLAEDQPAVFYPLNILSYALPPQDAVLFTALARLLVAALGAYWFTRTIGGGRFGALISAVTYAFSGFMIVWLGHPHTNVAAWLPAWFLTLEWLYRRSSPRHIALVAVVVAAQLTGGHAETALYTLTAGGIYYLFRVLTGESRKSPGQPKNRTGQRAWRAPALALMAFVAASALGFALAAVQLLPFGEWLGLSAEWRFRTEAESLRLSRLGPKYWLAGLLPVALPNIFNNPTWPGEYRSFFPGWNFVEQTLYIGVIGVALAAGAVVVRFAFRKRGEAQEDKRIWFLAALGLVALGAALRLPVFDWVNQLPLFNIAAYGRMRLIYTFCLSILAGFGARDVFDPAVSNDAGRVTAWLLIAIITVGVLAWAAAPQVLMGMAVEAPAAVIREMVREAIVRAFRISNLGMYWPLVVAAAGVLVLVVYRLWGPVPRTETRLDGRLAQRGIIPRRSMQAMVLLLVVVDLFALGMGYHTVIEEDLVFPETPAIAWIKSDRDIFRVVGTSVDLMPNTNMMYGLEDVRGLDFAIGRYRQLCEAIGGHDWLGYGILFTERLPLRLLGLLNVKYVVTSSQLDPDILGDLRLLGQDGDIRVYENLLCLPRAFVVYRARVIEQGKDALLLLQDAEFDLGSEIILEEQLPSALAEASRSANAILPAGSFEASAEITRYEANRVVIRASTPVDGLLFLSDTYYPGWKAYVDGLATPIYQANYAFRALHVPPGEHEVEFVYEPESFRLARFISLLALFGVSLLWIAGRSHTVSDRRKARRGA
jgi:hypothetical protein